MADDDPPLFAALAAIHRVGPRHHLREDRMTYNPDPDLSDPRSRYGAGSGAAYGADDDPRGPTPPPLDPSAGGLTDIGDESDDGRHNWPFGWTDIDQQPDPAVTALTGRGGIRDLEPSTSVGTGLVACPTCGTGVAVDRISG